MARLPQPVSPSSAAAPTATPAGPRKGDVVRGPFGGGRETVESIVIAFTLALLFRAFEAEAFVIPTGSMAPTLMGRHKDLVCESCGRDFRVGCSAELDEATNRVRPERMVSETRCPNCGNPMPLTRGSGAGRSYDPRYPSFSGDRILVNKFVYDILEPQRWDVIVFHYPEEAKVNYIKRLVGLPGETINIVGGDIWTSRGGEPPRIARKPPDRMLAMLQCVHDSRFVSPELERAGWPRCWSDWSRPDEAPRWTTADEGRSFSVTAGAGGPATLRYRHFLPTPDDWAAVRQGRSFAGRAPVSLVDDFQPYNAIDSRAHPHWVGDLAVQFDCETQVADGGRLLIDLVEAGVAHRCEIDLSTGEAVLKPAGVAAGEPAARARTRIRGRGAWRILFANVDDELSLFVDGRRVTFDGATSWTRPIADVPLGQPDRTPPQPGLAQESDLAPVGITVEGAGVRVKGLRVLRDTYYIGAIAADARTGQILEEDRQDYALEADQFFVLGDNSAASKDSRLWLEGHHVDRKLLIGKALAIFWPHAVPASWSVRVPVGGAELRLPSWPNFGRMGFVR